jgi:hypothetical protein
MFDALPEESQNESRKSRNCVRDMQGTVVLERDRYSDENGQVVHERCYVRRLVAGPHDPPASTYGVALARPYSARATLMWPTLASTWIAIRSSLWETVHMEPTTRKLIFHKSPQFTGWACSVCGWSHPIPGKVESIETDFANHDCAQHPRKPPTMPRTN